ncbi:bacillithiol biosynthesis cysteine-adding enzyme BshC [Bacillus salacetis]|uniref:Putative cysteine ligase BshC n=1 Tax=Bacillus salacetis TaxID=2315464 RepID=A0A3A1R6F5_9BACI|nr:bacillithiol biosynthesis cysteine-adding enzyme BshC [Bacillus salacetis]RIW36312.1 bacillithiol biosynthesis cysteine-adding enzyme BshC [Bacillus salacetis]
MELESLYIPATNRFASLYLQQQPPVTSFFHYNLGDPNLFENRVADLKKRDFPRQALAEVIEGYMESFPSSKEVEDSLGKLREDASVIIGGQQAGLLTGPLYTIHKVISIIKLAKEQEKKINSPVIPVFWVAGEDHDYQEINHIFTKHQGRLEKVGYPERLVDKRMTSEFIYEKETMRKWVNQVIHHLGETEFTQDILIDLEDAIESCNSIVDFFSHIIMSLFKDYGLLIIDSAYPPLRELEKPFFLQLIEGSGSITEKVKTQQEVISGEGFSLTIDMKDHAANLFVTENGERILLEKEGEYFRGKNGEFHYSQRQLEEILHSDPHRFSNNVVTRPLMQEWLFPTLAFIAGPGEIAYWGELKQAFEWAGFKMPPIVPRLNLTFLERDTAKIIDDLELSLHTILLQGVETEKQSYWDSVKDVTLETSIDDAERALRESYEEIIPKAAIIDKGLESIIEKNLAFHKQQFDYLRLKTEKSLKSKHQLKLGKYDSVQASLRPDGSPQERIWNLYYFMNRYGTDFVSELMQLPLEFDGKHKVIKI